MKNLCLISTCTAALLAMPSIVLLSPTAARAATIPAGFDVFATPAGSAQVELPAILGGGIVFLEGANENSPFSVQDPSFSSCQPDPRLCRPLTAPQVQALADMGIGGLVTYEVQWRDPHGSVVAPGDLHATSKSLVPVLNTSPNFDTVVQRIDNIIFTAAGQERETRIQIRMLNLQSVEPLLIGGFHYELFVGLAGSNGPVCADPCTTQFKGNLGFNSTSIDASGVYGDLNLGVTSPADASYVGRDLPLGIFGLQLFADMQLRPLDGGMPINLPPKHLIFTNPGPGSFRPVPEPASIALLGVGILGLAGLRNRKRQR